MFKKDKTNTSIHMYVHVNICMCLYHYVNLYFTEDWKILTKFKTNFCNFFLLLNFMKFITNYLIFQYNFYIFFQS